MPRLKPLLIPAFLVVFATICGVAAAQNRGNGIAPGQERGAATGPADRDPKPAAAQMTTKHLLTLWERQSQLLKDLSVSIYRIDKLPDWDEEIHYEGAAKFQTPQLAYLDFRKVKTKLVPDAKNPKKSQVVDLIDPKTKTRVSDSYERIVCTGKEVWHYRFDKKEANVYTLNKDAQRRALDEGPLPFLFNMKADDALRRYQMALQGEDNNAYLVAIKPKLREDQESFSLAWVRLDRRYLLPIRITLLSPDSRSVRDFTLSEIAANQGVDDGYFRGVKYPGLTIQRNPAPPEVGQANRTAPRRNRAGQAAQRPRGLDGDQPR